MKSIYIIGTLLICGCASSPQVLNDWCGDGSDIPPSLMVISNIHVEQINRDGPFRLTGIVRDSTTLEPIVGANINTLIATLASMETESTFSDIDGKFCLKTIRLKDAIMFSSVGYRKKIIRFSDIQPFIGKSGNARKIF